MNREETHTAYCEKCHTYSWVKEDYNGQKTCERCHEDAPHGEYKTYNGQRVWSVNGLITYD